jgi:hypothetical protein
MRPRPALTLLVVFAAAAAASAQFSTKEATAQLKLAVKTRTGEVKPLFAQEQAAMLDEIAAFEDAIDANGYSDETAVAFFEALSAHVGTISSTLFNGCLLITSDASNLLELISDAEVVAGTPPAAFACGLGSTFDDARDKLAALAEKSLSVAFKRLNKTVKLLDKQGVNMVVVRRPLPASNLAFAPGGTIASGLVSPFNVTVDLAMSFSTDEADDDGLVCTAGQANALSGDVSVGAGPEETTATPDGSQRWHQVFGSVTGLPEGNLLVTAAPIGGGMQDTASIAVR